MFIVINLSAFYDWEESDKPASPADLLALRAKPGQDGKSLVRVIREQKTHTTIGMPETEIQNLVEHNERIGAPKSRERVVAKYLEDTVMPHHAHPDHWTSIEVHDDPAMEKALNRYFGLEAA